MEFTVRHDLWGADRTLTLRLPDRWNAAMLPMEGDTKHVLDKNDYRRALAPVAPLFKGKKEICILFDDLSRPTRAYRVMPALLELLDKCGIRDEQVRFICALGAHAALDNIAFRKKLGAEAVERFSVYNHNPYENCEYLGKTRLGTPVMVNKEYLSCDLRIGIGSFVPHAFCGFGGGYKIVFPAISHMEALEYHHGTLLAQHRDTCYGIGKYQGNALLMDLREYGKIARLDAKIDFLVNSGAEAVDIYAGDPDLLYDYMLARAPAHYHTKVPYKADIVFVNAYGKANESAIAVSLAESLLKDEGGHIVVLCDIEGGQVVHYLLSRFGKALWGRLAFGEREKAEKTRKIFVFSRYHDMAGACWFGKKEDLSWHSDLQEIVDTLEETYKGKPVDVLVLPDGTLQTA